MIFKICFIFLQQKQKISSGRREIQVAIFPGCRKNRSLKGKQLSDINNKTNTATN